MEENFFVLLEVVATRLHVSKRDCLYKCRSLSLKLSAHMCAPFHWTPANSRKLCLVRMTISISPHAQSKHGGGKGDRVSLHASWPGSVFDFVRICSSSHKKGSKVSKILVFLALHLKPKDKTDFISPHTS